MIDQLKVVATVLDRSKCNNTQELREKAMCLNWVAGQIDTELAKLRDAEDPPDPAAD